MFQNTGQNQGSQCLGPRPVPAPTWGRFDLGHVWYCFSLRRVLTMVRCLAHSAAHCAIVDDCRGLFNASFQLVDKPTPFIWSRVLRRTVEVSTPTTTRVRPFQGSFLKLTRSFGVASVSRKFVYTQGSGSTPTQIAYFQFSFATVAVRCGLRMLSL